MTPQHNSTRTAPVNTAPMFTTPIKTRSAALIHRLLKVSEPSLQLNGFAYTFIFVFLLVNVSIFFLGAAPAWQKLHDIDDTTIRFATAIARGGGAMLNFNAALVVLVACRNLMSLLRTTILNMVVPFDKAMPAFHTLVGNALVCATLLHVSAHTVRYAKLDTAWDGTGIFSGTNLLITGIIATLIIIAMRITTLPFVKRRLYEMFYWTHAFGFVMFFVTLVAHGSHQGVAKSYMYVIPVLVIYALDRVHRLTQEKGSKLSVKRGSIKIRGNDIVCLTIPKMFQYDAGQYCEVKIPQVSHLQWHPFTIASSPNESVMKFYIKVVGNWTTKLANLVRDDKETDLNVHVRGPYGAPAQHVGQYEHIVLISGGVGATPFCSIAKHVHHWISNFTERGGKIGDTKAKFSRNQSVRGTPHMTPGTPTRNAGSVNPSRNMSRSGSRNGGRRQVMSRSGSNGMMGNFARNWSRTESRNDSRPASRPISRTGSGALERFNSDGASRRGMHRATSVATTDSIGMIIEEQRNNQPNGPIPVPQRGALKKEDYALTIPGTGETGDDLAMERYMDTVSIEEHPVPDDYDEALGNPEAPIPDRRAMALANDRFRHAEISPVRHRQQQQTFELVTIYDSEQDFSDGTDLFNHPKPNGHAKDPYKFDVEKGEFDPMFGDWSGEMEEEVMQDHQPSSNLIEYLGMSYGGAAMQRYIDGIQMRKARNSHIRNTMTWMEDAVDEAMWTDRSLFYLQSVTVHWLLVWIVLLRFEMVATANITGQFQLGQTGFGVYNSLPLNIIDMVLATFAALVIGGGVFIEMYTDGFSEFLSENVGNSFDMFVLSPLLFFCIALHILNFAGVGSDIMHISKLTVFVMWPTAFVFFTWRFIRIVGPRVQLAENFRATHARTKSVDFIWVSKKFDDDKWLLNEILPISDSPVARFHRYVTREKERIEPWQLDFERVPVHTTYDRPKWDDIFTNLIERSKSGSVIGIFFCGPDSMAHMIREAALGAMQRSMTLAIQKGYQPKKKRNGDGTSEISGGFTTVDSERALNRPGSQSTSSGRDPTEFGCAVRVAFRVENFS